MLRTKDILDEKDKRLRKISTDVTFPIKQEYKDMVNNMIEYLRNSQIDEIAQKYDLRPGMGMAAPQLGVNKRFFVVVAEKEVDGKQDFDTYIIFNPVITSHSEELIYAGEGEGCLSIKEKHEGYVPRPAYIKVKYHDLDGQEHIHEAYDFEAIAIQHEIDHLNGILFYDHINKQNPFAKIPNSFGL